MRSFNRSHKHTHANVLCGDSTFSKWKLARYPLCNYLFKPPTWETLLGISRKMQNTLRYRRKRDILMSRYKTGVLLLFVILRAFACIVMNSIILSIHTKISNGCCVAYNVNLYWCLLRKNCFKNAYIYWIPLIICVYFAYCPRFNNSLFWIYKVVLFWTVKG